jgi:endonuclease/exonuclease/phosphatase family metal-dependent hydrolase
VSHRLNPGSRPLQIVVEALYTAICNAVLMSRLRVATWNISGGRREGAGEAHLASVVKAIRALRADLVALQEVYRSSSGSSSVDQPQAIAEVLGPEWTWDFAPVLASDNSQRPGPTYGNMLLSRLSHDAFEHLSFSPLGRSEQRTALLTVIQVDSRPLTVAAVHLSDEKEQNVLELKELQRVLEGRLAPWLLMGDLNMPSVELNRASRRGWQDAGAEGTSSTSPPSEQLGHVLYKDPTRVLQRLDSRVVAAPVSNHQALVVDLQVTAPLWTAPP